MSGDIDRKDKSEARNIALALLVLVVLFVAASVLIAPMRMILTQTILPKALG